MTCNGNSVCFQCRLNIRCETFRIVSKVRPELIGKQDGPKCPSCGELTYFIGPDLEVPPKNKLKAWKDLFEQCMNHSNSIEAEKDVEILNYKHTLEMQIAELKNRPDNPERARQISDLLSRLADIKQQISINSVKNKV